MQEFVNASTTTVKKRIIHTAFETIQRNGGLVTLLMKDLTSKDMRIIAKFIKSPNAKHLTRLWIGWNEIGDKGGEEICTALMKSKYCKLEWLSMEYTGIGINTIKALGRYLRSPSSNQITHLNLSWNKGIGDVGVEILRSAIEENQTISSIWLYDCEITNNGAIMFEYLISNLNSSLSNIYLDDNKIDRILEMRITHLMDNKKRWEGICHIIDLSESAQNNHSSEGDNDEINNFNNNNNTIDENENNNPINHNNDNNDNKNYKNEDLLSKRITDTRREFIITKLQKILEPLPSIQFVPLLNKHSYNYDNRLVSSVIDMSNTIGMRIENLQHSFSVSNDVYKWRLSFLRCIVHSMSYAVNY